MVGAKPPNFSSGFCSKEGAVQTQQIDDFRSRQPPGIRKGQGTTYDQNIAKAEHHMPSATTTMLISGTAGEHKNRFSYGTGTGRSPTPKLASEPIPEGKDP